MDKRVAHSAYPHFAGSLFDCPGCEAQCFCKPGETVCVRCAIAEESATPKTVKYISRFSY